MELSIFKPVKKKTVLSLHYSPSKPKQFKTARPLSGQKILLNKPNFLHFTQRQRQNINFFDTQPVLNSHQTPCQKQIDYKISTSFFKTFKLKPKHFNFLNRSLNDENSQCTNKQTCFKIQPKPRFTLRKKAYKYKNQQPCVGMYNAKPQHFMKRIAKNQLFRKEKSCHNITSPNPNHQHFCIKNLSTHSQKYEHSNQKINQKIADKDKKRRKNSFNALLTQQKQRSKNEIGSSFFSSSKIKIKCFDMSKQTARQRFKVISNKIEDIDCGNNYIQKNYKKQIYIPAPMSGQELGGFYERQKKKYRIQSSCGILKHIKLQDFIKIHRNQVMSQDQNFD